MKLLCLVLVLFLAVELRAQEIPDHLLSLNFDYTLTGIFHHGWGIGADYEQSIFKRFSIKTGMGHATFQTAQSHVWCTSVSVSAALNYYPFGNGLSGLYFGMGNSADFLNYFGSGDVPDPRKDNVISLPPILGWKFIAFRNVMLDLFGGYKRVVAGGENYRHSKEYANAGPMLGFNFKILVVKPEESSVK